MARKKGRQAKGTAASPPVPTGEVVVRQDAAATVRQDGKRADGTNLPGSNGGVHRGPDLKPRNMMRAILLKAYSDEGYVAEVLAPGQPKPKLHWRKRKKVRHAAVHDAARVVQRILHEAAD